MLLPISSAPFFSLLFPSSVLGVAAASRNEAGGRGDEARLGRRRSRLGQGNGGKHKDRLRVRGFKGEGTLTAPRQSKAARVAQQSSAGEAQGCGGGLVGLGSR